MDPLHYELKVDGSLLLGSGTIIASQSSISDKGMIGQIDVLSDTHRHTLVLQFGYLHM